jgi:hypothetical protein
MGDCDLEVAVEIMIRLMLDTGVRASRGFAVLSSLAGQRAVMEKVFGLGP